MWRTQWTGCHGEERQRMWRTQWTGCHGEERHGVDRGCGGCNGEGIMVR